MQKLLIIPLSPNNFKTISRMESQEFKSFYKTVKGNEGAKCKYPYPAGLIWPGMLI